MARQLVGSLTNRLMENAKCPTPTVGMGATSLSYSDRSAFTIVEVGTDGKRFWMTKDTATRIDKNGMSDSQQYAYVSHMDGHRVEVRQDKRGNWREVVFKQIFDLSVRGSWKTDPKSRGSVTGKGVLVGVRDEHYDFSF